MEQMAKCRDWLICKQILLKPQPFLILLHKIIIQPVAERECYLIVAVIRVERSRRQVMLRKCIQTALHSEFIRALQKRARLID